MISTKALKLELQRTVTAFRSRFAHPPKTTAELASRFHRAYYDAADSGKTWAGTHFLGIPILKCPFDLWTYQELIYRLKPDLIIETGTYLGGSAYYFASICQLLGKGRVVTIDVLQAEQAVEYERRPPESVRPPHPRLTYLTGSSLSNSVIDDVTASVREAQTVMVILDSDHSRDHVYAEMRAYGPLVSKNSYLVVEDGNVNGNPVLAEHGPGPLEAIELFMAESSMFVIDQELEHKHLFTFNPKGYLRRVS